MVSKVLEDCRTNFRSTLYTTVHTSPRGERDAHKRYAFSSRVVVSLPCQGQRGTEAMVCVDFPSKNEIRNVSRFTIADVIVGHSDADALVFF